MLKGRGESQNLVLRSVLWVTVVHESQRIQTYIVEKYSDEEADLVIPKDFPTTIYRIPE